MFITSEENCKVTGSIVLCRYGIEGWVFIMFRASITPNTMISQLSESRLLSSSLRIRSTRSTRGNVGVILHRLESKKIQKEGVWKANAASRH